jgi:hypothetical protein
VNGRAGTWTEDGDSKLKDTVQTHGGKNWGAIAALVPDRTKSQCSYRWHGTFVSKIDPTTARAGKWSEDEDSKLKDCVAIAALVAGRSILQCVSRWHNVMRPSNDRASGRTGT